jgi:hypothetical protein
VPDSYTEGDKVTIFFGHSLLYIVRKIGDADENKEGKNRYRLVGHAYVHGIMDGELVEEGDDGEKRGREGEKGREGIV